MPTATLKRMVTPSANSRPRHSGVPRPCAGLLGLCLLVVCVQATAWEYRGHAKLQGTTTNLPGDSLLQDFGDDPLRDTGLDLRVNLAGGTGGWRAHADYQLLARQGDEVALAQSATGFGAAALPDDARRVFDLTHRISRDGDRIALHRLDRLYLAYSSTTTVIKLGRQAVSWGNGLIYNPVDFFNPFDPAAIDTEYKTGDDMLYTQYLFESGADLQALWVGRRDDADHVDSAVSSVAAKYHGFVGGAEYDLLVAEHFDERIVALGGSIDLAQLLWRGDIMLTDTGDERFTSLVVNASHSTTLWRRNLSANIEFFYNDFGIDDGDYGGAALAANPGLLERIARGELFTLGSAYLATAASLELTPLWWMTATLFVNLDDDSSLLQLLSRHDLQQDLQLLLALNLPHGDDGSEFGGIDSATDPRPLALGASLFAQLAWYY